MCKDVDVAIVGAGSAGLSALRSVKKTTSSFVLIDPGPLGTTCARVGCMPSKALIHIANAYHRRLKLGDQGISGGEHLRCDIPAVLRHIRALRDRFANGMIDATRELAGDRLISEKAVLIGPQRIQVGRATLRAKHIILAPGGRPVVPREWQALSDRILTSNSIFEQTTLPKRIAVVGLGAIGLELGQAFARLGLTVIGFNGAHLIGTLSDPEVNAAARDILSGELPMHPGERAEIEAMADGLCVRSAKASVTVDKVLLAMGIRPNLDGLGLETLGVELDDHGMPPVDSQTSQIADLPVYLAGDANGIVPVLHEALDEGLIAGRHSMSERGVAGCTCRRTPLRIIFTDPQCAVVGASFESLQDRPILIGSVPFSDQSRAVLEGRNTGLLRIYVDPSSACILGAELAAPDAEHLAHLLVLAIQQEMTVFEMLQMPFYHPTLTEAVRSALRDVAGRLPAKCHFPELSLCESCPEYPLA